MHYESQIVAAARQCQQPKLRWLQWTSRIDSAWAHFPQLRRKASRLRAPTHLLPTCHWMKRFRKIMLSAGRRATNGDWKVHREIMSEAAVTDCWSWRKTHSIPQLFNAYGSLVPPGFGLAQLAQMNLVVKEQIMTSYSGQNWIPPATVPWHRERRRAGSVAQPQRKEVDDPLARNLSQ